MTSVVVQQMSRVIRHPFSLQQVVVSDGICPLPAFHRHFGTIFKIGFLGLCFSGWPPTVRRLASRNGPLISVTQSRFDPILYGAVKHNTTQQIARMT